MKYTKEQILEELKAITVKLGKFPTHDYLRLSGRSDLRNAIIQSKIKISQYAEELGEKTVQKSRGIWSSQESHIEILHQISNQIGHFPSSDELNNLGYGGLRQAMFRSGQPWSWYQKQLGFDPAKKDKNYWSKEETVIVELKAFIETHSLTKMPTLAFMQECNREDLRHAIQRSDKSIHYYATKLGFKPNENSKGYWKDFANLEKEIRSNFSDMLNKDMFPNQNMLQSKNIHSGYLAKHGGLHAVAKRMGYKPPSFYVTSDGHYVCSSYEYILDDFLWSRNIAHEVNGHILDSNYRYDFKIGDLYIEIWGYEDKNTKRCMNYAKKKAAKEEYYKSKKLNLLSLTYEVFFKKLPKDIEDYLSTLFSTLGFDVSLKEAIYKIENTMKCIGSDNLEPTLRKHKSWTEESVLSDLEKVKTDLGHFPKFEELEEMNRYDLVRAINRRGGINHYKELMGIENDRKSNGYYTEEVILDKLNQLTQELGSMPGWKRLKKLDLKLYCAINNGMHKKKWPGLTYFRNKIAILTS